MTREEELQHQLDEGRAEAEALRRGVEKLMKVDSFRPEGLNLGEDVVYVTDLTALLDRIDAGGSAPYREHVADLEAKLAAAMMERRMTDKKKTETSVTTTVANVPPSAAQTIIHVPDAEHVCCQCHAVTDGAYMAMRSVPAGDLCRACFEKSCGVEDDKVIKAAVRLVRAAEALHAATRAKDGVSHKLLADWMHAQLLYERARLEAVEAEAELIAAVNAEEKP